MKKALFLLAAAGAILMYGCATQPWQIHQSTISYATLEDVENRPLLLNTRTGEVFLFHANGPEDSPVWIPIREVTDSDVVSHPSTSDGQNKTNQ